MRNSMPLAGAASALRWAMLRWNSAAQASASVTLGNSTRKPSPVVLMRRPLHLARAGSISSSRTDFSRASVPVSSPSIRRL